MNVTQLLLFGYVDSSPTVVQLQLQVPLWWQGKQPGPKKLIKVAVELFPEQLVDVTWFTTFLAVETSLNLLWHPMSLNHRAQEVPIVRVRVRMVPQNVT